MSKPYTKTSGADMVREMNKRLGRLERGSSHTDAPVIEDPVTRDVRGAMLYVQGGKLMARMGTTDHEVSLGSGGPLAVEWGDITGTLADQTDLAAAVAKPSWQSYTPALLGTTTNPPAAGYTSTGRYIKEGRVCHFSAHLEFTPGWSRGAGNYQITLPLSPLGYDLTHRLVLVGEISFGGIAYPMNCPIETNTAVLNRVRRLNNGTMENYPAHSSAEAERMNISGTYAVSL